MTLTAPGLVLAGTGPAGGKGIKDCGRVSWPSILKGLLTFRDPKMFLFFSSTAHGRGAAKAFLARLQARKEGRDPGPSVSAFLRKLSAITAWGRQAPQGLGQIRIPTLVANGDHDILVPTPNSHVLAGRIKGAELVICPDAGHGGIFQNYGDFTRRVPGCIDPVRIC